MSNVFESQSLNNDFVEFSKELFKTNSFKYSADGPVGPVLKSYHRLVYVLALIELKLELTWTEDHQFIFANEILSDLLSNSVQIFQGFQNVSQILLRRIIENFYHHIFFFEHPVEYELLNLGNDYIPVADLRDYYNSHPVIRALKDPKTFEFNAAIYSHYQELCRVVHSKGETFMGLARTLDQIKQDFDVSQYLAQSNQSLRSVIYLLVRFHRELTFTAVEKNLISLSFPKPLRATLMA